MDHNKSKNVAGEPQESKNDGVGWLSPLGGSNIKLNERITPENKSKNNVKSII